MFISISIVVVINYVNYDWILIFLSIKLKVIQYFVYIDLFIEIIHFKIVKILKFFAKTKKSFFD